MHHYKTVACDVTVVDQSGRSEIYGGFLKQTSVNSEVVSTSKLLWSAPPSTSKERLGSEDPIRSLFQSERSHEKIRGTVVVETWSASTEIQWWWTATVRHRHTAYGTEWQRSRRRSTTQQLAGGQSRLRREENYEVV